MSEWSTDPRDDVLGLAEHPPGPKAPGSPTGATPSGVASHEYLLGQRRVGGDRTPLTVYNGGVTRLMAVCAVVARVDCGSG